MPAQAKFDHFLFLFVLGVLSVAVLSSIYFGFKTYVSDTNVGQNDNLLVLQGKFEDEGQVLAGCGADWCTAFRIKDSSTQTAVSNALATLNTTDPWSGCTTGDGGDWTYTFNDSWFGPGDPGYSTVCWLKVGESIPSTVSVTVTKSGYKNKTENIPTSSAAVVYLVKESSSDSSSGSTTSTSSDSSTSSPSNSGTTTTLVEKETLQNITLPKTFTAKKSKTTDLSKLTDLKKVKNFTLDVPGKTKIVFKDILDLSSDKLVDEFKNLDKYVKISESGKVTIDSKALAVLNKKATVTMSKLTHLFEPEILVGGKKDTKKVVSNVVYDKKTGQLNFDVTGFSTITAVPKIELLEPVSDKVDDPKALIKGRISDPNATLTARFNELDIESILVGVETGEFFINNVTFKEGENFLTVEAVSKLGKVLPLVKTITYQPVAPVAVAVTSQTNYPLLIVSMIVVMIFLVLVGYLIYRKRKHHTPPKQIQPALAV